MNTNLRKLTEEEIYALCRAGDNEKIGEFCKEMGTDEWIERKKLMEWILKFSLSMDTITQIVRAIEWAYEKVAQIEKRETGEVGC